MRSEENNIEQGIKDYRDGVVALMAVIDLHFPHDDEEVQLARNNLLESLGRLRFVHLQHEERAKKQGSTDGLKTTH